MHAKNTHTIYAVKIVNKWPCNLLNKIQNVFINGNQLKFKTVKITQIIPWFYQFYAKTMTGNFGSTRCENDVINPSKVKPLSDDVS